VLVVNRVGVESYLRGVVPLEMTGRPSAAEQAAVEAQAVASRSYAYAQRARAAARGYDLVATVQDQVYGGADAERPATDLAVERTAGLVLTYGGRVVAAPYSSTCGGSTAEATEVWWRRAPSPYLQRVSDRVPGTRDRYYCDASPRFTWTQRLDGTSLAAALDRYLSAYASVPRGGVGAVRFVSVQGTTPSGRAAALRIDAERGSYEVRGDDIRRVLRTSGGDILGSTYFTVQPVVGRDGRLQELTLRGGGNGHGVGMCQWGAMGRARAGQSFREILQAYYPGTSVAAGA
jgi:stage II sporulation protein D